jgi:hypothetical protein
MEDLSVPVLSATSSPTTAAARRRRIATPERSDGVVARCTNELFGRPRPPPMVAFDNEHVDLYVDGVLLPPPPALSRAQGTNGSGRVPEPLADAHGWG